MFDQNNDQTQIGNLAQQSTEFFCILWIEPGRRLIEP
jgi:hypothetical protein